jgi:SAM-dependent methyltransferase
VTGPLGADAVADLHASRPGITEDLLAPARSASGLSPVEWLLEPLPADPAVLDLCCGSAPVADHVGRYTGVDSSPHELAEARRRRPRADVREGDALDAAVTSDVSEVDAVVLSMALMLLPLEAVLARAAAVLPRGGLLTAVVPLRGAAVVGTAYGAVLDALGESGRGYPEPLDRVAERAVGFAVLDDSRDAFVRPPDPDLVLASFYAPTATPVQRAAARALLTGPVDYPLRRLVLRRR